MAWRTLLRYLSNNEELIRRLSETYPIRRAAQLTAYLFSASKEKFLEHQGKYERAGGWAKTKRDAIDDLKDVQNIGKEYVSHLFRPYTDTWANYKENRRQQEQNSTQTKTKTKTTTTTMPTRKLPIYFECLHDIENLLVRFTFCTLSVMLIQLNQRTTLDRHIFFNCSFFFLTAF
jgi:hypothetical protein